MTGAERRRRRRLIAMGERQDAEEFGRLFAEQMLSVERNLRELSDAVIAGTRAQVPPWTFPRISQAELERSAREYFYPPRRAPEPPRLTVEQWAAETREQLAEFERRNGSPSSALPATLHVVDEVDRYPAAAPERRPLTASDVVRMRDELERDQRATAQVLMQHATFSYDYGTSRMRVEFDAQAAHALGLGDPLHDPRAQAVLAYVEQHVREQVERLTREAFDPWRGGTAQHTERMRTDPSYRAFMDPLLAAQERGELLTGPNDPPTRAHVPQLRAERAARTDEELRDALQRRYRALYGEQGRSQADRQAPEWAKPLQPGQRVPRGET